MAAAFYPLEYAVSQVGGDHVRGHQALTKPGRRAARPRAQPPAGRRRRPGRPGRLREGLPARRRRRRQERGPPHRPRRRPRRPPRPPRHRGRPAHAGESDRQHPTTPGPRRTRTSGSTRMRYAAVGDAIAGGSARRTRPTPRPTRPTPRPSAPQLATLDAEFRTGLASCRQGPRHQPRGVRLPHRALRPHPGRHRRPHPGRRAQPRGPGATLRPHPRRAVRRRSTRRRSSSRTWPRPCRGDRRPTCRARPHRGHHHAVGGSRLPRASCGPTSRRSRPDRGAHDRRPDHRARGGRPSATPTRPSSSRVDLDVDRRRGRGRCSAPTAPASRRSCKGLLGLSDQLGGEVRLFGSPATASADWRPARVRPAAAHPLGLRPRDRRGDRRDRAAGAPALVAPGRPQRQDRPIIARRSTSSGSPTAPAPTSAPSPAASSGGCSSPGRCAAQPDVLLMDEPTAGVDAANQHVLAEVLGRLAARGDDDAHRHPRAGRVRRRRRPASWSSTGRHRLRRAAVTCSSRTGRGRCTAPPPPSRRRAADSRTAPARRRRGRPARPRERVDDRAALATTSCSARCSPPLLVGLAAPLVGVFLVQRRLSLIGDGMGHVALAGVAVGLLTGTCPRAGRRWSPRSLAAVAIELIRGRGPHQRRRRPRRDLLRRHRRRRRHHQQVAAAAARPTSRHTSSARSPP